MIATRRAAALVILAAASLLLSSLAGPGASAAPRRLLLDEPSRWRREAAETRITRDDWGIAHVHGRTDADAVFGMAFAQAEDDFNRVETNYLTALGRLAEAEGEGAVYKDLRQRLFIDPDALKQSYNRSPKWLRLLMVAWADGLNFYLATHPGVHPRVIHRFEPWMALSFSEGSIGGDIERVSLERLEAFYKEKSLALLARDPPEIFREPKGSNGIAIAPANTKDGHALLLINPHTSFYFRSELQMTSDEGLNAYGAVTWGQFFIYQGFNSRLGWMHTSSGVDNVDEFIETIVRKDGGLYYRYGSDLRPVAASTVKIDFRKLDGGIGLKTFTVFRTHHGPVIRAEGEKWVAIALMNKPVAALEQSFLRTKAQTYADYLKVLELKANSSNNTIFADADGDIAYLHPQFVPRRDDQYDYTRPVDGSDPNTDWRGLHALSELPSVTNPKVGWVMNTNDWPYSAAGPDSPKRENFPRYMDRVGENPRGVHAALVLKERRDFTLEGLNAAAFDSYLPAFKDLLPPLFSAFDALSASDPYRAALQEQVELLRHWDLHWSAASEATSLAVFWGENLWNAVAADAKMRGVNIYVAMASAPSETKLAALKAAGDRLKRDFGSWRIPWGEINRFQRLTGDIDQRFDDGKPSVPVPFTSAQWGSLASFGAKAQAGTKRYYGTSGNSFVAVVEFGPKVRAVAVSAGGESGDPTSAHFDDQALRYAAGALRPVYFYPEDLKGHVQRVYRPGS